MKNQNLDQQDKVALSSKEPSHSVTEYLLDNQKEVNVSLTSKIRNKELGEILGKREAVTSIKINSGNAATLKTISSSISITGPCKIYVVDDKE